ncbi:class II aldolase/adducin family protein [Streptomyces sp. NBC_00878]|uniref:class II aldolase/adducin family protein n=1 Tax=Streptomyces sp. NBC_00878 TaxID=2975854 RepID=UPI00224F7C43|nr:class II aldolase/adducin family protein [Streptomyces sp. NBC_00878]MCX4904656.1 class II aldolase/adducin family protein [Streptomyces sp. NBC_00878]
MTPDQARRFAVEASHALAAAGQGDMVWGHVAVRDPRGDGIWIKAPGWGLEEVREDRLQLVSFDGQVLQGDGAPHKECHIHLEILAASPDLTCTVHTHAPSAVAFAALGQELLPLSHEGALFAGEDAPRFKATGGLVSTPALGRALAATLGEAPAALMPSHGLVSAGRTVPAAVMHAVLLDRACAVQLTATAAGAVRVHSDLAEARAKRAECWPDSQLEAGWHYLLRRVARASVSGTARPAPASNDHSSSPSQ